MYMSFLCVFITPNNLYSEPLTIDLKVALLCEEQVSRVTRDIPLISHQFHYWRLTYFMPLWIWMPVVLALAEIPIKL